MECPMYARATTACIAILDAAQLPHSCNSSYFASLPECRILAELRCLTVSVHPLANLQLSVSPLAQCHGFWVSHCLSLSRVGYTNAHMRVGYENQDMRGVLDMKTQREAIGMHISTTFQSQSCGSYAKPQARVGYENAVATSS